MSSLVSETRARVSGMPGLKKLIKYSAVSVIAVVITMGVQFFCLSVLDMSAFWSAITASSIAAVPSYFLNRMWVWGKNGKSHVKREVIPFWVMVFVGLGASAGASHLAESWAHNATDHGPSQSLIILAASFGAFAALWVLKFVLFNKILFVHHPQDLDPALDGRTGIPT